MSKSSPDIKIGLKTKLKQMKKNTFFFKLLAKGDKNVYDNEVYIGFST